MIRIKSIKNAGVDAWEHRIIDLLRKKVVVFDYENAALPVHDGFEDEIAVREGRGR